VAVAERADLRARTRELLRALFGKNLSFTTDVDRAIADAEMIFVSECEGMCSFVTLTRISQPADPRGAVQAAVTLMPHEDAMIPA